MAKPPRFIPPGTLVEITARTNAARFHLRPSSTLTALVLGVLGRALSLYPVALHAFVMLSNHWHALVTAFDAERLAGFLQHMHGNVAKAAQEVNGIVGKVWAGETSVIPVLDDGAQLERLKYLLAHGAKERLVESPLVWPGPTAARALAGQESLVGHWVDQKKRARLARAARGNGERVETWEYTERYEIDLVPLPALEAMSGCDRLDLVRSLLAEIEQEHRGSVLGVEAVLAQDPMARPDAPKRGPAPHAHTTDPALAKRYDRAVETFYEAYWRANLTRPTTVGFPTGAFLPASRFAMSDESASLESMLY